MINRKTILQIKISWNEYGIRQILSQNPLFSIAVGHIFVNFSSDISHFLFRKTWSRREVGKQGNGKKSVSVETTDNRVSQPHRRITDGSRSVHRLNEIAVFFRRLRRQTTDANSCWHHDPSCSPLWRPVPEQIELWLRQPSELFVPIPRYRFFGRYLPIFFHFILFVEKVNRTS